MIKATYNQLSNVGNRWQGKTRKVLCVCSAGLLRSPTLANVLYGDFGFNTRACGSSQDFALIPISEALVEWADEIVFVNIENFREACNGCDNLPRKNSILQQLNDKAIILDIEDSFGYDDPELRQMLRESYTRTKGD